MEQTQIVLRKEDFVESQGMLFMPLSEIARHLGYKNRRNLTRLYRRNKEELQDYYGVVNVTTPRGTQETGALNELGCYTIAMLASTEKAGQFRKAIACIIQNIRKGDLVLIERVKLLEMQMKAVSDQIREGDANFEEFLEEYYTLEKQRICRLRSCNMNKTQYDNARRMIEQKIKPSEIVEMLDIPMWILEKIFNIENRGVQNIVWKPRLPQEGKSVIVRKSVVRDSHTDTAEAQNE